MQIKPLSEVHSRDFFEAADRLVEEGRPLIVRDVRSIYGNAISSARLRSEFAEVPVYYRRAKNALHPQLPEGNELPPPRTQTTLAAYFKLLEGEDATSLYLTGTDAAILRSAKVADTPLGRLYDELTLPSFMLPLSRVGLLGLWISVRGVRSRLHFDLAGMHNFNIQIEGRKEVRLVHPDDLPGTYPCSAARQGAYNFCQVDLDQPDYARFPRLADVTVFRGELGPGDAVLMPAFWLHSFRHLGELNLNLNSWWEPKRIDASATFVYWSLVESFRALGVEERCTVRAAESGTSTQEPELAAPERALLEQLEAHVLSGEHVRLAWLRDVVGKDRLAKNRSTLGTL